MENIAQKDFEHFCKNNDTKQTNMKADFYLAGFYKGQQRMIDKACEAYCKTCDTQECAFFGHEECDWVKNFRKELEDKQ